MSAGQWKNPSHRQEWNPWPPEHRATRTHKIHQLSHLYHYSQWLRQCTEDACYQEKMTGPHFLLLLHINSVKSSAHPVFGVQFLSGIQIFSLSHARVMLINSPFTFHYRAQNSPSLSFVTEKSSLFELTPPESLRNQLRMIFTLPPGETQNPLL